MEETGKKERIDKGRKKAAGKGGPTILLDIGSGESYMHMGFRVELAGMAVGCMKQHADLG